MITILFSPSGASNDRAIEIVKAIKALKASAYVFSDVADQYSENADARIIMPKWSEELSPLLYTIPSQILSLELGKLWKTLPRRLATDESYRNINWTLIQNSKMVS